VPTDTPLTEEQAWKYFRDVVMGIEYRECLSSYLHIWFTVRGLVTLRANVEYQRFHSNYLKRSIFQDIILCSPLKVN
jgi:hypothetical protein